MKAKYITFNEKGKILKKKICDAWICSAEKPIILEISLGRNKKGDYESVDIGLVDIYKEVLKNLRK